MLSNSNENCKVVFSLVVTSYKQSKTRNCVLLHAQSFCINQCLIEGH